MNESKPSEETLFEALAQLPGPQRTAALQEACAEDSGLRERLEILLAAHDRGSGFMAEPVAPPAPGNRGFYIPVAERLGDQIGPYKLLQQIGEGGCGVVYMAQQDKPMRRLVALKVIKLGMDTKQVVTRFEAERQALALMDHPNIAKVLDAGATELGRPFFVMELVRGVKITDYCDQNQLATAQRLDLFIRVCRAVQHAHQKGVIHRDLKPSNILVTVNDGVPVPKVIDFGIAKATQGRLTDQTLVTAFDQFIGTPAYVSPEQAVLTSVDIDTRSDIYSLGVLLYELLTGKTPFDTQQLLATGLDELRRTIREEQPMRPSTRLSTMGEVDLTTVARARRVEPAKLTSLLRGDLDWIVMKCLEKDRTRRYETANGLARDIERHLRHEPVVARPTSRIYEFQKTVRRHWVGFAAVAAVLAALAIGTVVSTFEAIRARRAEERALKSGVSEATARTIAQNRLYEAKLSEARATRLSGVAGRRFDSLTAIAEATTFHRSPELRDEATACLALTDLRVQKTYHLPSRDSAENMIFDEELELYAYQTNSGISVRHFKDDREAYFLSVEGANDLAIGIRWLQFGTSNLYLRANVMLPGNQDSWRLWDLSRNGALVLDLRADFLALAPDDHTLAIARNGTLSFQDLDSSEEPRRLSIGNRLDTLHFSPDGARIAGFKDESPTLRIWEVASGRLLVSCANSESICAIAWNQGSTLLAVGGMDGDITLWDAENGARYLHLEGHRGRVVGLAFDHQGGLLASTSWDGTTKLWDPLTGQLLLTYPRMASGLRFSLDDQMLASAYAERDVQLLQVAHPTGYRRIPCHERRTGVFDLDFSPDARLAAIAGGNGLKLVDMLSGQELESLIPEYFTSVHFDFSATPTLWADAHSGLYRWPLNFGHLGRRPSLRVGPPDRFLPDSGSGAIAFDRAQKRIAIASRRQSGVLLWNLLDSTAPPKFCAHGNATFVTIDPTGKWVATGTWKGTGVKVWEFASGRPLCELPVPGSANVLCSPDGNWLATYNVTELRIWDTRSWLPALQTLPANPGWGVGYLAFSPKGSLVATCHDTQQIQVALVPSLRVIARLVIPFSMKIAALRFISDGTSLAAVDEAGTIHHWDLRTIRSELKKLSLDWDLPPFPPNSDLPLAGGENFVVDAGVFSREELARAIPARDTNAPANLIDLSAYYNAPLTVGWHSPPEEHNDLSELPRGLQMFDGVRFDVRGLIQIGTTGPNGLPYPNQIHSIAIGRSCQRLHFLHSATQAGPAHKGDELGSYIIHYADGEQIEIPIAVGKDLADWWSQADETNMNFVIAWTGHNPSVSKSNRTIRLFKTTWENPRPAVPIRRFDFVSDKPTSGHPFLVALTAEP